MSTIVIGEARYCDCGHTIVPILRDYGQGASGASDYAYESETGRTLCYDCADKAHRAELTKPETTISGGYLSEDGRTVQTYTGGFLLRVTWRNTTRRFSPSGGAYNSVSWRAVAPDGSHWYGRGDTGMYTSIRRAKAGKVRPHTK